MKTMRVFLRSARSWGLAAVAVALSSGAVGCAHHVRLVDPSMSAENLWVCRTTSGPEACQRSTVDDPAQSNASGTAFVTLPRACNGRYREIFVRDAHSSEPVAFVRCAAASNAGGSMGGGATPTIPSPTP